MRTLKDKVVVITGAGQGIGQALAITCAEKGARLALMSKTDSNLAETARLLNLPPDSTFKRAFDISNNEEVETFSTEVMNYFGQVDIVINNAGVAIGGLTFEELDVSDFEWIFSINVMGTIYMSKAFLPHLKKRTESALVNISSIFGLVPMVLKTPYCSTKYALTGFTDSLRMELDGSPVHVMGVYPGGVKTRVTLNARKAEQQPEYAQEFNKLLNMEPSDAAEQIVKGIMNDKETLVLGTDAKQALFARRFIPGLLKKVGRKTMNQFKSR